MIHISHKVRILDRYLESISPETCIYIIITAEAHVEIVKQLGFSIPVDQGQSIIPDWAFGSYCRNNSEGLITVDRVAPKEQYYRYYELTWKDWGGNEHQTSGYYPSFRFRRKRNVPFDVPLRRASSDSGIPLIISGPFRQADQTDTIRNTINMYIELFGECFISDHLSTVMTTPIRYCPWTILPPGNNPWERISEVLNQRLARYPNRKRNEIRARHDIIRRLNPDFMAYGTGGFSGYIIFGFEQRGVFVLESEQLDNATYVLGDAWETISKLSKAEILYGKRHLARIIHSPNWETKLKKIVENRAA